MSLALRSSLVCSKGLYRLAGSDDLTGTRRQPYKTLMSGNSFPNIRAKTLSLGRGEV